MKLFTMEFRLKFCFFFIFGSLIVCEGKYGYVTDYNNEYYVNTTDYFADIPDVHVARATYSNEINQTGYVKFKIDVNNFPVLYSAGMTASRPPLF